VTAIVEIQLWYVPIIIVHVKMVIICHFVNINTLILKTKYIKQLHLYGQKMQGHQRMETKIFMDV